MVVTKSMCLNVQRHSTRVMCHSLTVLSMEEESKKWFLDQEMSNTSAVCPLYAAKSKSGPSSLKLLSSWRRLNMEAEPVDKLSPPEAKSAEEMEEFRLKEPARLEVELGEVEMGWPEALARIWVKYFPGFKAAINSEQLVLACNRQQLTTNGPFHRPNCYATVD